MLDLNNELVWEIFSKHLASQARVAGLGGFIGFDYASLPSLFAAYEVAESEWFIYFDKISVLAKVALTYWGSKD